MKTANDNQSIIVRYVALPETVKSCVIRLDNDSYLIAINKALSVPEQETAEKLERIHIRRGTLTDTGQMDISFIESKPLIQ